MSKTFGVGILGCGNISTTYLNLAPLFKGLEVRAVADILPDAAKSRAEEYGVRAQTVDELLANSEIDIIVNLTIPEVHYQVSKDIVSAGKHAYSEKPLVLAIEQGMGDPGPLQARCNGQARRTCSDDRDCSGRRQGHAALVSGRLAMTARDTKCWRSSRTSRPASRARSGKGSRWYPLK